MPPPLRSDEAASGVTLDSSLSKNNSGTYDFGTNATYRCLPGFVFNGTFDAVFSAQCYGTTPGWRRPINLICVAAGEIQWTDITDVDIALNELQEKYLPQLGLNFKAN